MPLFKENFNLDLVAINGTEKVELPIPATYVVDGEGVIQFAFVQSDYIPKGPNPNESWKYCEPWALPCRGSITGEKTNYNLFLASTVFLAR